MASAGLLMLCGCQRESFNEGSCAGMPIEYDVAVAPAVKGELINVSGSDKALSEYIDTFKVDAYNGATPFITGQEVVWNEDKSKWESDPIYYWPQATKLTFFASANTPATGATLTPASTGITLTYTVPATAETQKDILLGSYVGNGNKTGKATIQFEHPLTAVVFKAGDLSNDVATIELDGLAKNGAVTLDADGNMSDWTAASAYDLTATLTNTATLAKGDTIGVPFVVIPQDLTENSVDLTVTLKNGVSATVTLNEDKWLVGCTNIYTVKFTGNPAKLDVTVTPWGSDGSEELTLEEEPDPVLKGVFSVSLTKKVQFSRGNLYCIDNGETASPRYTFEFEKNQYDYRCRNGITGDSAVINEKSSTTPSGTSGLFQWVSENAAGKTETSQASYGSFSALTQENCEGKKSDTVDYGKAYGDGNTWTTLSSGQWEYLFTGRNNASSLVQWATVCGVNGLVLAPDEWSGALSSSYDKAAWQAAESAGLVFLPASGSYSKDSNTISQVGTNGYYWSSSAATDQTKLTHASRPAISDGDIHITDAKRCGGLSVRLVKDYEAPHESVQIGDLYWATENLSVTESGNREFNSTGHVNGDYFQWAASYDGYKKSPQTASLADLVLYSSFTSTLCGDGADAFTFRTSGHIFQKAYAPYTQTSGYSKYGYSAVLEASDDIATLCYGGSWRMPTKEEFQALLDNTYWSFDKTDKGFYVFTPDAQHPAKTVDWDREATGLYKTDALLFFPVGGWGGTPSYKGELRENGQSARYWTSTHDSSYSAGNILNINNGTMSITYAERFYGGFIRPVHD